MKKLLFLLLVMALGAGVVFAVSGPIHPPGAYSLEATMSENSGYEAVVTPDTVLATVAPVLEAPSSLQAVPAVVVIEVNDNSTILPHSGILFADNKLYESCTGYTSADFYLRC